MEEKNQHNQAVYATVMALVAEIWLKQDGNGYFIAEVDKEDEATLLRRIGMQLSNRLREVAHGKN